MASQKNTPPKADILTTLRGLILDCDGVLTPGDLYYDESGRRLLRFHARDGFALSMLCRTGFHVGVLSGRPADIAEKRLRELGVKAFAGQCRDKNQGVVAMCHEFGIEPAQCAFMGDDLPDLAGLVAAGLPIAVGDAAPEVLAYATWVTRAHGGRGAVREVAEAILQARGDWQRYAEKALLRPLPGIPVTPRPLP